MLNQITIIRATSEQLDDAIMLFASYRQFYGLTDKQTASRNFIQERLEKQDSVIFIAYDQQQACGFVQLYFSFSSLSVSPTIILNDLYVPENHRQKGIATQLMQYVTQFARDNGYRGISLCTANDNHKARALYEQAGYQIDEQFVYYFLNLN